MIDVTDQVETDVRERILTTAERLFREIGYQKTTVADIARDLRMSPANVYRFFDSKKSINAGVARRLMGEVEQASGKIASGRKDATERLRQLLSTVHRMNSDRYVADSKMHDMVAAAMEESWDVCRLHMECITATIATVIADGVASGEFRVTDVAVAAQCTCTAMARFFHPQLIAECADKPGPTLDQMIDFVVAGLSR
ncbi:MAG TPA: TetR/AcrR family transcriptional regulator [Xanthobacteraceae bacterium]|jgi:AcrR family transcriptional regulator|nr:TetR/AcrR family transcriptional regulator [Xanthobacteraceae bacterium]